MMTYFLLTIQNWFVTIVNILSTPTIPVREFEKYSFQEQHKHAATLNDDGIYKGKIAEKRGLFALAKLCIEYNFLYSVRRATFVEDRLGIDLVLTTSEGIQYFQVKSK